jgi:hypothetical protein
VKGISPSRGHRAGKSQANNPAAQATKAVATRACRWFPRFASAVTIILDVSCVRVLSIHDSTPDEPVLVSLVHLVRLVSLVYLVPLVVLVCLVFLVQENETNKIDQTNQPNRLLPHPLPSDRHTLLGFRHTL